MTFRIGHGFSNEVSDDYRTAAAVAKQRDNLARRLAAVGKSAPRHAPRFVSRAAKASPKAK